MSHVMAPGALKGRSVPVFECCSFMTEVLQTIFATLQPQ